MAGRIRMMPSRITAHDTRRVKTSDPVGRSFKQVDPFYTSPEWQALRKHIIKQRGWRCQDTKCETPRGPWKQIYSDHIIERQDGGAALDPRNILLRCGGCHGRKTRDEKAKRAGWIDMTPQGASDLKRN